MTEDIQQLEKYENLNKWGLPLSIASLAFLFEYSLQKRLGNPITSKTFLRCTASATVAFLFTKYVFKTIFSQQKKLIEEANLKKQLELQKI